VQTLQRSLMGFVLILIACPTISADAPCDTPCAKRTSWFDFNAFTLRVTLPNTSGYGQWRGQWDTDSFDISVDAETADGKTVNTGQIILIGGRVMATKGAVGKPGYEIDALDSAILQQQLVLRLLGYALPEGMKGLKGSRRIDYGKEKTGIQFATPSAHGFVTPPWRLRGMVKVIAPDVIEYKLDLTSGEKGKPVQQGGLFAPHFSGRLSKTSNAKIADSMSLDGWNILSVGPQVKKTTDGTIYDYSAVPSAERFNTIAEVRRQLAAENHPGERDTTQDFTGFWKSKCEDAFGLQIKPYGTDGMYSIAFCGPGGCDDPDTVRKTFITGDRHFEVISEDELIQIRPSGDRDRSVRCSKDPNLELKY
jgi:hypothetical protein